MAEYAEPTENKKILIGDYEDFHDLDHDSKKITDVLGWVHPIIDKEITVQFLRIEKDGQKICDIY